MDKVKEEKTYKLYFYEWGNLVKFGKGKTGANKHEFKTFEECEKRIEYLLSLARIQNHTEKPKQQLKRPNLKYKVGDEVVYKGYIGIIAGIGSIEATHEYKFKGYSGWHDGDSEHYMFDEKGNNIKHVWGNDYLYVDEFELKPYIKPNQTTKQQLSKYKIGENVKVKIYDNYYNGTIEGIQYGTDNRITGYRFYGFNKGGHSGAFNTYDYDHYGEPIKFISKENTRYYFIEASSVIYSYDIKTQNPPTKVYDPHTFEEKFVSSSIELSPIPEEELGIDLDFEYPTVWEDEMETKSKTLKHQSPKVMQISKKPSKLSLKN